MSLTAANSILMLSISSLYVTPQQIQGYSVDDVYDFDSIEPVETQMGVDGRLSAGYVNVPINQSIMLSADSPSIGIFDNWYLTQKQIQDVYFANGTLTLPSKKIAYNMTKGVLVGYQPAPNAGKILKPMKFAIRWESISPGPMPGA